MNRRNLLRLAVTSPLALLPRPEKPYEEEWARLHEQAKEHWAKILEIVVPQVESEHQKTILLAAEVEDGFEKYISVELKSLDGCFSFIGSENRKLLEQARKQICPDWGITLKTDFTSHEDWELVISYWYSTLKPKEP